MSDGYPGTTELTGIDVILPLGKPGAPAGQGAVEMTRFNGRTLLEWAVEEACHAGAARILAAAPAGWAEAGPLLRHLRQTLRARRGGPLPLELIEAPAEDPEGWDGLIRAALGQARGGQALVLDPVTLLTAGGRIATFAGFMLRRAAQDRGAEDGDGPLLATAELDWEEALSLPVLAGPPSRPALAFDRPGTAPALTVFAGRALVPLPMPEALPLAEPQALFPGEALARALVAAGGSCLRLLFQPLDLRFAPPADAPPAPGPAGLPFAARLGLGALQRVG